MNLSVVCAPVNYTLVEHVTKCTAGHGAVSALA